MTTERDRSDRGKGQCCIVLVARAPGKLADRCFRKIGRLQLAITMGGQLLIPMPIMIAVYTDDAGAGDAVGISSSTPSLCFSHRHALRKPLKMGSSSTPLRANVSTI